MRVTQCERICIGWRKINLTIVFAGQTVDRREIGGQFQRVSSMDFDLGFFDQDEDWVQACLLTNPYITYISTTLYGCIKQHMSIAIRCDEHDAAMSSSRLVVRGHSHSGAH